MIEEYLNQDSIIVVRDFPQYGLTLADSSIILLINKDADYPSLASALITLYHEMIYLLYRKLSNTSFFKRSFDETQNASKKFELSLLGNYNTCHRESCHYIISTIIIISQILFYLNYLLLRINMKLDKLKMMYHISFIRKIQLLQVVF